ncbi:aliphatic sulfonate ABC transporter permease SsuC [Aquidulcibacter sp.]|uniref:aliphatic sulfonate ABC transporter permease SsuC n=1 Tax=Aquidulcibacter sp. TaxID=2052990 RepID=UPI0025B9738F|nr:aliphatic sulfonate ABC transporter permease SsuC [Aquidulcibacter sp.]MCA3694544.1 aliphatic sulfonate ABC transporter permease SsuC [Aquidulcibacter sp.]
MAATASEGPFSRALPWLVPLALVILWQVSSSLGWLPPNILPAPTAVLEAAWTKLQDGSLIDNLGVSFARAMSGLIIGGAIGFSLGLLNGLSKTGEMLLDPTLQMIRNIPHLALIPLVIIWFGIGESARLFLVALGVFFPIYLNTLHGVRNVDPQLIEMGRIYGMNNRTLFLKVILPGALPSIFVGLRFALGVMWLTLIVAETIAANSGIGHMAMAAREFMQTDIVVLSIVIYAILGKLADSATRALERKFLAWNPAYAKV